MKYLVLMRRRSGYNWKIIDICETKEEAEAYFLWKHQDSYRYHEIKVLEVKETEFNGD